MRFHRQWLIWAIIAVIFLWSASDGLTQRQERQLVAIGGAAVLFVMVVGMGGYSLIGAETKDLTAPQPTLEAREPLDKADGRLSTLSVIPAVVRANS